MIPHPLEEVDLAVLQELRTNRVHESRTIDYKRLITCSTDRQKKEFVADVTCMANTAGGDILFGVDESDGIPTSFPGVEIENWDGLQLQLASLIRDGTQPRLHGVAFHRVEVQGGRYVVVARVRRSALRPHRVIVAGHGHFYGRDSSQKYQLDVEDLRRAFTTMASAASAADQFVSDRVRAVAGNRGLVEVQGELHAVLHLIPEAALAGGEELEISSFDPFALRPLPRAPLGMTDGYSADAVFSANDWAYTALFRSGIIEAVEGLITKNSVWYPRELELELIEALPRYLATLARFGVEPPIRVFLSLTGLKGHSFPPTGLRSLLSASRPAPGPTLELRGQTLESLQVDAPAVLRRLFDRLWNAFGFPACPHYDEAGSRI